MDHDNEDELWDDTMEENEPIDTSVLSEHNVHGSAQFHFDAGFVNLKTEDVELIERYMDHDRHIPPTMSDTDSTSTASDKYDPIAESNPLLNDQSSIVQELIDAQIAMQYHVHENQEVSDLLNLPDTDIPPSEPEVFECVCSESFVNQDAFVVLTCGCVRCLECLNVNVEVGLEARKNYPPRCQDCDIAIDYALVNDSLNEEVRVRWLEVQAEFDDASPTYCVTCANYIPRSALLEEGRWGKCTTCNSWTCTGCGHLYSTHKPGSSECPDTIEKSSLEEMVKRGYKPCPWCKQMIERIEGCDHMSCDTCGKNFCYNCGRKKGRSELPCNCQGGHAWVDEDIAEHDPDVQQDILDRIAHGANRHELFDDQGFVPGNFHGFGRGWRLGEEGEDLNGHAAVNHEENHINDQVVDEQEDLDDAEADRYIPRGYFPGHGRRVDEAVENHDAPLQISDADDQDHDDGWNHWRARAPHEPVQRLGFARHIFRGQGRRLGEVDEDHEEEARPAGNVDHVPVSGLEWNHWNARGDAEDYNVFARQRYFRGQGHRLGD